MKPIVNDSCIACGTCEAICPAVFKVQDSDGKMIAVVQDADFEANRAGIDESIGACPVQAISMEE
ncbi:MAG: ferredoxin [Patescibacteria group bacterium]|jgi:ferredoxin